MVAFHTNVVALFGEDWSVSFTVMLLADSSYVAAVVSCDWLPKWPAQLWLVSPNSLMATHNYAMARLQHESTYPVIKWVHRMIKHPIMDFHHLSLRNFLGTQWLESIYFSNKPWKKTIKSMIQVLLPNTKSCLLLWTVTDLLSKYTFGKTEYPNSHRVCLFSVWLYWHSVGILMPSRVIKTITSDNDVSPLSSCKKSRQE